MTDPIGHALAAFLGALAGAWLTNRPWRRPSSSVPPPGPAARLPIHDAVALSDEDLAAMEEDAGPGDVDPVDGRTYQLD